MVNKQLSEEQIDLGRTILLSADAAGVDPEGAYWLFDRESEAWDLFISTSLIDGIDVRELYKNFGAILSKKLSCEDAGNITFILIDPDDSIPSKFREQILTDHSSTHARDAKININGNSLTAKIYRMTKKNSLKKIESSRRNLEAFLQQELHA